MLVTKKIHRVRCVTRGCQFEYDELNGVGLAAICAEYHVGECAHAHRVEIIEAVVVEHDYSLPD